MVVKENTKKYIFFFFLFLFFILTVYLEKQNKKEKIEDEEITIDIKYNTESFEFLNSTYSFQYPGPWQINKSQTGQFENQEDRFELMENENKIISLTILPLSMQGIVQHSYHTHNEQNIEINNINGTRFQTTTVMPDNSTSTAYLLKNNDLNYLWINYQNDEELFDSIVQSFKINSLSKK